jgi:hypothetical protein
VDNGSGSDDPQAFLTAGRTGWDESVVTDAAGLGFFSLLGLSDEVIVSSRAVDHCAWRMCVTQAAFLGEEVQWDPVHEQFAPQPSGTRIEAKLGSKADLEIIGPAHEPCYQQFRFLFPLDVKMTVILRGGSHPVHCLGRTNLNGCPFLDTPAGRLVALPQTGQENYGWHRIHTVWEHRVLKDNLWDKVERELDKLPDGKYVVKALRHSPMFWIVDPTCGVRPKLPDRRELIHDESYHAAARTLATALYEAFNPEQIKEIVAKLEIEDDLSDGSAGVHSWLYQALHPAMPQIFRPKGDDILKLCGWEECPYKEYSEGQMDGYKEDGYSTSIPDRNYLIRNPLHVGDDDLACALNASRCWASDVKSEKEIEVHVFGAKIAEISGFSFGTCDRIAVVVDSEVYQELDHLAFNYQAGQPGDIIDKSDDGDGDIDGGCLLLKTEDPMELRSRITGLRRGYWGDEYEMRYFVYESLSDNGDLEAYIPDEDEGSVDDEQLENDLIAAWMKVFQPEAAGAQARYNQLVEISRQYARETSGLCSVTRLLRDFVEKYPEVEEAATMLDRLTAADSCSISEYKWDPGDSHYNGIPVKEVVGVVS